MPNEPAFPHVRDNGFAEKPGMSLRDYFAGQALIALLSNEAQMQRVAAALKQVGEDDLCRYFASYAYEYADAMLAARDA